METRANGTGQKSRTSSIKTQAAAIQSKVNVWRDTVQAAKIEAFTGRSDRIFCLGVIR